MPQSPKFTRDEIAEAALNLVRKNGIQALTARNLGKELGTSSRPVFTAFENMEEVQNEVLKAAKLLYNTYSNKGLSDERENPFRGVGMQYFRFAKEEPQLFKILFMRDSQKTDVPDMLTLAHDNFEIILGVIQELYSMNREDSFKLFQTMWLFTHGIACLQVSGAIDFTDDEVRERLTEVGDGAISLLKNNESR